MDRLWSPWRYDYIKSGAAEDAQAKKNDSEAHACVFCAILQSAGDDESKFILHRAGYNFILLNLYPYTSGHMMIVPYEHMADLDAATDEVTNELMHLTKRCERALREVYRPDGFNIGMNLGAAAGAGVAGHFHQHILPRWMGDANFMTTVGETRVLPEELSTTYQKLHIHFSPTT
jgi:ATP adenylyltransferase